MFGLWISQQESCIYIIKQLLIEPNGSMGKDGFSVDFVHPLENSHL
jgi:hypothetical protein